MIKKFICLIFGHKFMAKAYTGTSQRVIGVVGNEFTVSHYRWISLEQCPRCGKHNS